MEEDFGFFELVAEEETLDEDGVGGSGGRGDGEEGVDEVVG